MYNSSEMKWSVDLIRKSRGRRGNYDLINNRDSAPLDLRASRLAVQRRLIISTWNMYSG